MYKEGESSFATWTKKRVRNNLSLNGMAVGEPGSGKTYAMLSFAYDIDPDFEIRQIAFTFREVMEILNADWFKKKKWKICLFEEMQTSVNNRTWQGMVNKLFNYLLSTFRHQNVIFLMTTPYHDFVDAQSRKLIHCLFECRGWNKKTQKSLIRPKLLQYNAKMKKFYEHSLYVIKNSKYNKLEHWYIDKPPLSLTEPYEVKKTAFTTKLNEGILRDLDKLEEKEKKEQEPKSSKPLTEFQSKIVECWERGIGKQKDIAKELSRSPAMISDTIKLVRNKGYFLENYLKSAN